MECLLLLFALSGGEAWRSCAGQGAAMSADEKTLREALQTIHAVACGKSDRAYMRIPADPKRDADLILADSITELVAARAEVARLKVALENYMMAGTKEERRKASNIARLALGLGPGENPTTPPYRLPGETFGDGLARVAKDAFSRAAAEATAPAEPTKLDPPPLTQEAIADALRRGVSDATALDRAMAGTFRMPDNGLRFGAATEARAERARLNGGPQVILTESGPVAEEDMPAPAEPTKDPDCPEHGKPHPYFDKCTCERYAAKLSAATEAREWDMPDMGDGRTLAWYTQEHVRKMLLERRADGYARGWAECREAAAKVIEWYAMALDGIDRAGLCAKVRALQPPQTGGGTDV